MKSTTLAFTKMHGLGNDFIIVNSLNDTLRIHPSYITQLANRHTGIGFDQLLVIEPSENADYFCRIYNADGSEAEQCGNGLRCVARYLHEEKIHLTHSLKIETKAGIFPITIHSYEQIQVAMGSPIVSYPLIELKMPQSQSISVSILSMGNPHAIMQVTSLDNAPINELAQQIASHAYFPQGVNVGFMQITHPHHIQLRTIERGAGETLACGSNACAAVVAGIVNGWLQNQVTVLLACGELTIDWQGNAHPVYLTGPAVRVYEGKIEYVQSSVVSEQLP